MAARNDSTVGWIMHRCSVRPTWILALVVFALPPASTEAQSPPLSQTGRWQGLYALGPPYPNGYSGAHLAVLKGPADTTRALVFGQSGKYGVWSFVPSASLTVPTTDVNFHGAVFPGHDLFCSGHATLNGRLVVVGGQYRPEVGTETAYEFNPLYTSPTETQLNPPSQIPPWRRLENTARGRWYATITGLPTNQLLATSGTKYGYNFVFGGDTGTLQDDLRPLSMGGTADWAVPVATGSPPSARKDHSAIMQYIGTISPYLARMVIFGGEIGPSQKKNDLRAQYLYGQHDSTSLWVPFTATPDLIHGLPAERSRHTAIYYDGGEGNRIMIVYGGQDASGSPLGDVWKLNLGPPTSSNDTGQWTRLLPSVGPPSGPGDRYGHAAIFDPGPNDGQPRMLVFGGRASATSLASTQVWSLNITGTPQWTAISGGPRAREGHGAVGDEYFVGAQRRFRMVIFGGHDGAAALDSTWSLSRPYGGDTWTWAAIGGGAPPARWRHATSRDWFWDRMVVLGGQGTSGLLSDLWTLDLSDFASPTWSALSVRNPPTHPAPAARAGHTVVAHPLAIVERYPERLHRDLDVNPPFPGEWATIPSAARFIDPYPFMFVLPSGNVFHAGHRQTTNVLNTGTWTWNPGSITATYENAGSAVMYRPGSVLRCGKLGSDGLDGVSNTETIQFSGPSDVTTGWAAVAGASLRQRKYHNLTVLPTGHVLVTGGLRTDDSTTQVKVPQIWNSSTAVWSTDPDLASDRAIRNYHSAAILLPDARILSTGGEKFAVGAGPRVNPYRDMATIFEPPYLFNGNAYALRPVIDSAPTALTWGQVFTVCTSNPGAVSKVCLIRPGAVTHSFNQDQRYVPLTSTVAPSGQARLFVTAPPSSAHAPPGDYLLFIVGSSDGPDVPSIAKWVRLQGPEGADPCDDAVPGTIAVQPDVVTQNSVLLTWGATADDDILAASGAAKRFDLRWSGLAINSESRWSTAGQLTGEPTPGPVGTAHQLPVTGLNPCTVYHFALRAEDDKPSLGALPPDVLVQTPGSGCDGGTTSARPVDGRVEGGGPPPVTVGSVRTGIGSAAGPFSAGSAELAGGSSLQSPAAPLVVETRRRVEGSWQVSLRLAKESDGLDPAASSITVERERTDGGHDVLGEFAPGKGENLLGLCALRERGRVAIPGFTQVEQIMARVRSRDGDHVLTEAQHSRLGLLGAEFVALGGSVELLAGDVIDLTYAPAAEASQNTPSWYVLVRRTGEAPPTPLARRPALGERLPERFALYPGEPNPASSSTLIRFDLPAETAVKLEVFDLLGRRVATLADRTFPAGTHSAQWNLRDPGGVIVRPGIYVYRITAAEFRAKGKMSVVP